ncbi:HIT family protein [Micromonospora sp. NPDC049559]|uniref:HIT family protein n=1 Tax=Micromonospora sp. NPDC049559 TaxID=3155923 RepID=UPI00344A37B1
MMTAKASCPFCEIVRREAPGAREVYRDESAVAFLPLEPATLGHTLVVPRIHAPDVWSLDERTAAHLARVTLRLSHAVKRATAPEGLNIIQSNGAVATQSVFHLHVHIVPRWSNDGVGPIWPPETSYSEKQKDDVWERLRYECDEVGAR